MAPNYFKILNRFWDEVPDLAGYKTDHSALFFAIVDSINRNGWKDTQIEYDRIINKVRLGKDNYLKGRKWLQQNGFIVFTPGKGDYAKASFGLGYAVLGKTAPGTASPSLPQPVPPADAVLPETAEDTAPSTAPGTASVTYLIKEQITTNDLPITQQQQPADAGDDGEKLILSDLSGEEKKREGPTPNPLPTSAEVRDLLTGSALHKRYAIEQLKIVSGEAEYAQLLEMFITQRELEAKDDQPVYPDMYVVKRHFTNWLGKRPEINQFKSNGNANTPHGNKRTPGALRPTAIGNPDYRGKGSHCDVDL